MGELGFFRGERVELIDGIVLGMAPIGPSHMSMVDRLGELLILRLAGRARVRIQGPLDAADGSAPQPDVAIVPSGLYADRHPDRAFLAIEVADSSLQYDREIKGPLYAASAVDEYWIVDVAGRAIEVHAHAKNGRYTETRRLGAGERLAVTAFPDVEIDLADLLGR